MQPSSVQHVQSMAAAMAELTRQNQELTRQLNSRRHSFPTRRSSDLYLTKPYLRGPFEGGWKDSAHYLVWNPLKVHHSFESSDVVKGFTRPVV